MNRKVLYGYQIMDGKLVPQPQEAAVVSRVFGLYLEGKLHFFLGVFLHFITGADRPLPRRKPTAGDIGHAERRGHSLQPGAACVDQVQDLVYPQK